MEEEEQLVQRLRNAERDLADAAARLRAALAAVFAHENGANALLDQFLTEYRQAMRAKHDAAHGVERWQRLQDTQANQVSPSGGAGQGPGTRQAAAPAPAGPPTPGLLFARWLYEHGYIAG
jgi:hypothetical protein